MKTIAKKYKIKNNKLDEYAPLATNQAAVVLNKANSWTSKERINFGNHSILL